MRQHPEEILQVWMNAVNGADLATLTGLYDAQAVLIPTFSNRLLKTPELIHDYFVRLSSREELSVSLHGKTLTTQPMGNEIYALSGLYRWQFLVDGELLSFEARFSYMIDMKKDSPILHHHSSQIPRVI